MFIPSLACAAAMVACADGGFEPRNGDMLFRVGEESQMGEAIREATDRGAALPFTHAAIVEVRDGRCMVIEACSHGVVRTDLETFLSHAARIGGRPAVAVCRLREEFGGQQAADAAVARAAEFIGQPYDYSFLPDNGRMYCSELLYECYLDLQGEHIFTARPMNFRSPDGSMPQFWSELFESFGEPVPEGVPGTNPADMFAEPGIELVGQYYITE